MRKSFFRQTLSTMMTCLLTMGIFLVASLPSHAFAIEKNSFSNHFDKIVKGRITDASSGSVLAGANVSLKGSSVSALTDRQGDFSISVPDDKAVLVVSFVGYTTQEITVGNRTSVNVSLQPASADLAQVVVVGYGTQSKRDVTGAVKSVNRKASTKASSTLLSNCCKVRWLV